MKKVFLILAIICFQFSNAQTDTKIIQKDFESMIEFTRKNQIDKIIDLTYPRFVKVFGKEGLTGMANGMMAGMGIKTIFEENPINLKMSQISKIKDGAVCMGSYDNSMILEFQDESMVALFTMVKLEGFDIKKLENKKIRMKGRAYLLAINDSYTNKTWKYLNYSTEMASMPQAGEIVSQEIITESAKLKAGF